MSQMRQYNVTDEVVKHTDSAVKVMLQNVTDVEVKCHRWSSKHTDSAVNVMLQNVTDEVVKFMLQNVTDDAFRCEKFSFKKSFDFDTSSINISAINIYLIDISWINISWINISTIKIQIKIDISQLCCLPPAPPLICLLAPFTVFNLVKLGEYVYMCLYLYPFLPTVISCQFNESCVSAKNDFDWLRTSFWNKLDIYDKSVPLSVLLFNWTHSTKVKHQTKRDNFWQSS